MSYPIQSKYEIEELEWEMSDKDRHTYWVALLLKMQSCIYAIARHWERMDVHIN